jgi:hypothetical protein
VLKPALPKWTDEAGVAKMVSAAIAHYRALEARRNREFDPGIPEEDKPLLRLKRVEEIAALYARKGNFNPLIDLLRSERFIEQLFALGGQWLEPETRTFLTDVLTGKFESKRDQKMTAAERRATNPIHNAADEFLMIEGELMRLYPAQSKSAVKGRAVEIAAERAGIEPEQLQTYLNRSRNSPQRIG